MKKKSKELEELEKRIKAVEMKIKQLKKEISISQKVFHAKCTAFDTFILFECETKAHLKEVLTAFPAKDSKAPNPFDGYGQIPYNYPYQIGIDNNIHNIVGRINYSNTDIGTVWIKFNPSILDGYLSAVERKVYNTELHYFAGQSKREIDKIKIKALSFGSKGITYYGGNEKLKCEETARELISLFIGSESNKRKERK